MADRGRNDPNKLTSLLLQPPNSNFSWSQVSGSAILMPVSQMDNSSEENAEVDTFLGQSNEQNIGSSQKVVPSQQLSSNLQQTVPSGPFSQLQQPLRPVQQQQSGQKTPVPFSSPTPPPTNTPPPSTLSSILSSTRTYLQSSQVPSGPPPPPATLPAAPPSDQQSFPNGTVGPPPVGPSQNFHRQFPFTYAPTPGLSGASLPPSVDVPSNMFSPPATTGTPSVFVPPSSGQSLSPPGQSFSSSTLPPTGNSEPVYNPTTEPTSGSTLYKPISPHWFYRKEIEKREVWFPFSTLDSTNLEEVLKSGLPETVISTDGGRYDVYLGSRVRKSVYWEEAPSLVRRCTWFYKLDGQSRFVPYEEDIAQKLEEHYRHAISTGTWHQRLELPGNQTVVMHNTNVMVHFLPSSHPDEWGNVSEGQMRPRVVKRGAEEIDVIEEGERAHIDHVVFVVHGVGSVCDFKFRSVVECLDDFRNISFNLLRSHFRVPIQEKKISRIEFLPVSWHSTLHGDTTGIDSCLKQITLNSISKLRHFTNDTLLDILFYTSPVYCQTIVDQVGSELNRIYNLFMSRNPTFQGTTALAGHSLGSLILFDILSHQPSPSGEVLQTSEVFQSNPTASVQDPSQNLVDEAFEDDDIQVQSTSENSIESLFEELSLQEFVIKFQEERIDFETLRMCSDSDLKELGLPMGPRKKVLAYMKELTEKEAQQKAEQELQKQKLKEQQQAIKADVSDHSLSPMQRESVASVNYFVGPAGTGQLSVSYPRLDFSPSCFFALGSPIAMFLVVRGNQTIGENFKLPTCPAFFNVFHPFDPVAYRLESLIDPNFNSNPVLIPHHKGRKRMHLELKESLSRMGSDLKQKIMDSLKYTWNSLNDFARAHRSSPSQVEEEVDRVVQEEIKRQQDADETESTVTTADLPAEDEIGVGQLNGGRRIDFVLQEKPIESFNEYLFALASHACYWESEDTVLLILKELYSLQGIQPQNPGRSSSQPKVQLYNPALSPVHQIPSSVQPFQASLPLASVQPPYSVPSGSNVSVLAPSFPKDQCVNLVNKVPSSAPPQPSSPPSSQPAGPPPLQGFVRSSPLIRK